MKRNRLGYVYVLTFETAAPGPRGQVTVYEVIGCFSGMKKLEEARCQHTRKRGMMLDLLSHRDYRTILSAFDSLPSAQ